MDYRQFQKYPRDLGARGLWHPNPFDAPKNAQWKTWRWQWPSSSPSSPRIKANCRGWSHPEHTDMLGNRTASRVSGWAIWGVLTPTNPPLMHWLDGAEREKAKDRDFSSDTQETSLHFQSLGSQRPSCGDANWNLNTLNLIQRNNNWTEQLV